MTVGVTGGIGSGKTTVCKIFAQLGIPIYYADTEAKRLMYRNKDLKSKIKILLGQEAYHRNGRLNRKVVAGIIFTDKNKLDALNALVHPAVREDAAKWASEQHSPYTIQEAALLVENGSYRTMDKLIVVSAPEETRIDRVVSRDHSTREQVKRRVQNQLPEEKKVEVADFVIDNSGYQLLIPQVWAIHQALLAR